MKNTAKSTPIYLKVCSDYREKIVKGELLPGTMLPSENELCSIYSLSRETIRKGLKELEQEGLISGEEGAYGLFVTSIDGEEADDSLNQWWCFTQDGVMLNTGVDDTMISDGDHYEAAIDTY